MIALILTLLSVQDPTVSDTSVVFVHAQDLWANGYTGKGIGVAVIDTGITPVPGLNNPGQVIDGPDLSFDSQTPSLAHLDGFGHGTHMAGIIAGHDPVSTTANCPTCLNASRFSDTTKFEGVAPEATLINVKVGASDGATDVSQVVAAKHITNGKRTTSPLSLCASFAITPASQKCSGG